MVNKKNKNNSSNSLVFGHQGGGVTDQTSLVTSQNRKPPNSNATLKDKPTALDSDQVCTYQKLLPLDRMF